MNITKKDFQALENIRRFLPAGEDLEKLSEEEKQILIDFDLCLLSLLKKGKKNNERTRVYMNEKRATDPTYGRPTAYKEEKARRDLRRATQKREFSEALKHFKSEEV